VGVGWKGSSCEGVGYLPLPELDGEDVVESSRRGSIGEQMSRFVILGELTR
jgi:hypothetical protein